MVLECSLEGEERVFVKAKDLSALDPSAQQHRRHADQHTDGQQISNQAIQVADEVGSQENKARKERLQAVADIGQQIIREAPGNEGVGDARPQTALQHGALRDKNIDRRAKARAEVIEGQAARAAPEDADDSIGGAISRIGRSQCQQRKEYLLDGGEHESPHRVLLLSPETVVSLRARGQYDTVEV